MRAAWMQLFKNVRVAFLGRDGFMIADKAGAARAVNEAVTAGWDGMPTAERFTLDQIATAQEPLEAPRQRGPDRDLAWAGTRVSTGLPVHVMRSATIASTLIARRAGK